MLECINTYIYIYKCLYKYKNMLSNVYLAMFGHLSKDIL